LFRGYFYFYSKVHNKITEKTYYCILIIKISVH